MNINDFERRIDAVIVDRGYDYYLAGNIVEVYKLEDYEYIFEVEGNEVYEVIVKIDKNGEILHSDCDCPYDFGPVCKHQVAAYFELAEMLKGKEIEEETLPEIREVLNSLSKEELINIIIDISQKDKTLRNSLIATYQKNDGMLRVEQYKRLLQSIVNKYTGREGFIAYREVYDFVSELEGLLERIEDDVDNPISALDLVFLLLEESIEAFQYADDSNGEIGALVTEVIDMIRRTIEAIDRSDVNLIEKAFYKLLDLSEDKMFQGWDDFQIDVLTICTEFADIEVFRNELRIRVEQMINRRSHDEYGRYGTESMLNILFEMIEQYGTEEEAEQFMKDNLGFPSFRESYINKHIKEKNYSKVIELALEGEEQDKPYAGLVSGWKKIRYTAYKELSMKEEQEELARELLLDGDFEYYKELKKLAVGDQDIFYQHLKQELKTSKDWQGKNMYLKLIVEENDLNEIMEFVRENPGKIETYAHMLVGKFEYEVIQVYRQYIQSVANSSSGRSDYQKVCKILKRYEKIAGKQSTEGIIRELSVAYKRRPAFIDELSRVL
ncbi:SWIM zinc finger family protein [Ectobacillus funiculus]|uniref:SWIM zinc finger domain-containing protein n=1 Tax=Ectobacillus funiculus TaxID=137993 RepID=A0ABV5WG27_9BACI